MSKLDSQLLDDDDWLYGGEENSSSNKEFKSQHSDTLSTKTLELVEFFFLVFFFFCSFAFFTILEKALDRIH
jgi:hypothetical protein